MSDKFIKLLATFFYIGDVPMAPGTVASLAGLLIYIIIKPTFLLYLLVLFAVTTLGLIISEAAEKIYESKDPPNFVIDEVAGILLACFLLPLKPSVLIFAFLLFRFFDITKPYPIKQLEKMKGGLGIMMDDLMAGFYTNFIMHIAIRML